MYDPKGKTCVTKDDIVRGLREMGIREGDLIQVHSSLSALGYVEGGEEAVVDALLETVGTEGTVMVPTFNHGAEKVFDLAESPSRNGAVTEAFRKRPEAYRSLHPTHPLAAIGPLAELLTNEHLHLLTFDLRSPLGKLASMGGYVLLLGVGMNVNTMAHVGETLYRVPCIGYRMSPHKLRDGTGKVVTAYGMLWRDGKCLIEWEALETYLRERGQVRDGQIGDAEVHLMLGAHVLGGAVRLAQELCPRCPTRFKPPPLPTPQAP